MGVARDIKYLATESSARAAIAEQLVLVLWHRTRIFPA